MDSNGSMVHERTRLQKAPVCRVPNLRTKKTAPALLHFLHHLGQACYKYIDGRQLDKRLELEGYIRTVEVDQILKHFEEDVPSLEEAIRDVRHENCYITDWPERCPREAATQVTERDDGTVEHRFDYVNAHSKEPFSLLLGTRRHEGRTRISKFHLKFGSA